MITFRQVRAARSRCERTRVVGCIALENFWPQNNEGETLVRNPGGAWRRGKFGRNRKPLRTFW
jgi:hypothetical protein